MKFLETHRFSLRTDLLIILFCHLKPVFFFFSPVIALRKDICLLYQKQIWHYLFSGLINKPAHLTSSPLISPLVKHYDLRHHMNRIIVKTEPAENLPCPFFSFDIVSIKMRGSVRVDRFGLRLTYIVE